MRQVSVGEHHNCVELVSGRFRIAITTEVGPRVIGGFIDGSDNIFRVLPLKPYNAETNWFLYGGHRFWHSPEADPRTYAPDNGPVTVRQLKDGAVDFANTPEPSTGIEKSIRIKALGRNRFRLTHTLVNRNPWAVELAPWALSVMALGGTAVIPLHRDPDASPYAFDRALNLWPYSEYTDRRLTLGREFITLKQNPKAKAPIKIGVNCAAGWAAYVNGGVAFVKRFKYGARATYPDNGSNVESYSCGEFLEVETLGPLVRLAPGGRTSHVEEWEGLSDVGPIGSEKRIKANLVARL